MWDLIDPDGDFGFSRLHGRVASNIGIEEFRRGARWRLAVKGASLKGGVAAGEQIPLLIDELPMLAVLGPYSEEGIENSRCGGTAR